MSTRLGIIGGGAAGLMAAVQALRLNMDVTVLEGGSRAGKKLSATGNGRGNFTNLALSLDKYPGIDTAFLQAAFSCFDQYDAVAFFESIGVYARLRNGYVYPRSEQASALTAALLAEFGRLGGKLVTDCKVTALQRTRDGFSVTAAGQQSFVFEKLILAAGGKTASKTGSDGSGFALARSLGHEIVRPVPALAGLAFRSSTLANAAGVRTEAAVSLNVGGVETHREYGELQITEQGISGIPVMHLSRYAARALAEGKKVEAVIDLLPEWDDAEAWKIIKECDDYSGIVNARLMKALPRNRDGFLKMCKRYPVAVTGIRDPETAQVTCGGVSLKEADPLTMASKKVKDLYLAGEVLDVDGRCGGYNLQWAWTSGTLAAYGAAGKPCVHHEPDPALVRRLEQAEVADRRR
ncbi:MAG: aminoacetone oxidase family FAD-binding enzyme [Lachnospiraceae bacterium]|nr:aminoacetone oxidase family FAD-binding enzyme [Lachnospiraceae bacterium]